MLKKNEKILDKIVKKDYSNELEKVLEKKYYKENAKSILLNIIYKLETSYKDYEQVKIEVEDKEKALEKVIKQIEKNCDDISLVNQNEDRIKILGTKSFLVEKNKKRIYCWPIERKLLYCISKISSNDKIIKDKYFIINETLSNLINTGNNINTVEPIRDFNGYSWTTIPREIESIEHNLIYQNILFLVGYEFLNRWIENKEAILDYMEMFTNTMEKLYGRELTAEFIKTLGDYSILIEAKFDKKSKEKLIKTKKEIEDILDKIKDNRKFVEDITNKKRKLAKEIKEIDKTINDKELIKKEYERRNEKLQLKDKIFSIRILSKIMEDERNEKIEEIEKLNELMKPQKFVEYKEQIEAKQKVLEVLETEDIQSKIDELKLKIQKIFLKCFEIKMKNIENKHELLKLIYELRYYNMLPYGYEQNIEQVKSLKEQIETIERKLIMKAHEMKLIEKISKQEEIDYELLKIIFNTRVINLEEINIKLTKTKEGLYLEVFDGNSMEEKERFEKTENFRSKDLYIMYNKKIKIFC